MTREPNLYFAYGSNLCLDDWHDWCGGNGYDVGLLQPVAVARLPGRRLAFTRYSKVRSGGVLDIRPCERSVVHGVLFRVAPDGWLALDAKEGAPHAYRRIELAVIAADGKELRAVTYEVCAPVPFVQPTDHYVAVVRRGLSAFDLPTAALEHALRG